MRTTIQEIRRWTSALEKIINNPTEVRMIVELGSTHKVYRTYLHDYYMIDLSNGEGLVFDEFYVTADFGDKDAPEPWQGNIAEVLRHLSMLREEGEIYGIHLESY